MVLSYNTTGIYGHSLVSRIVSVKEGSLIAQIRPENAKDTLCRNVSIYGYCRYEDKGITSVTSVTDSHLLSFVIIGCAFNHDLVEGPSPSTQAERWALPYSRP